MRAVQSDRDRLRVLLIVGDAEYARAVGSSLAGSSRGAWEVETVSELPRGRERLARGDADAVLVDFDLTGDAGLESLPPLCAAAGDAAVVVLVGPGDDPVGLAALEAGAHEYLVKGPLDPQLLDRTLRYAVERKRSADTLMRLEQEYPGLERVSVSHPMGAPEPLMLEQLEWFAVEAMPAFTRR